METLRVDTAEDAIRNIKGIVTLTPNEASLMDTWYSWFPEADTVTRDFLTVEDFSQSRSNQPEKLEAKLNKVDNPALPWVEDVPNFGFTFVFKRSSK